MDLSNNTQSIDYFWTQFDKAIIFWERPRVQLQLVAILVAIAFSFWLYKSICLYLKKQFPKISTLQQQDEPIRGKFYCLVLFFYLGFPIINTVITFGLLKLWLSLNLTSGLLAFNLDITILHCFYSALFASLLLFYSPKIVKKYQLSFGLPIFVMLVITKIVNLASNINYLLNVNLLSLFGSPISLGAILLSSVGLYLWCVAIGIIEQLLLPLLVAGDRFSTGTAQATLILVRYFAIGLGIILIFGYVGFNPTAFAAITGGLSVGLGFGLKEVFSNFVSGIFLLFEGVLRPGDLINIDGDTAEIKRLGIRAATVRLLKDNSEKIIPNQLFFTDILTTFTGSDRLVQDNIIIGTSYQNNPQQVTKILLEVAQANPEILRYPEPKVYVIEFANSSINYKLTFYLADPGLRLKVKSDVSKEVWLKFKDNDIEIPFPQQDIYIKNLPENFSQILIDKPNLS